MKTRRRQRKRKPVFVSSIGSLCLRPLVSAKDSSARFPHLGIGLLRVRVLCWCPHRFGGARVGNPWWKEMKAGTQKRGNGSVSCLSLVLSVMSQIRSVFRAVGEEKRSTQKHIECIECVQTRSSRDREFSRKNRGGFQLTYDSENRTYCMRTLRSNLRFSHATNTVNSTKLKGFRPDDKPRRCLLRMDFLPVAELSHIHKKHPNLVEPSVHFIN